LLVVGLALALQALPEAAGEPGSSGRLLGDWAADDALPVAAPRRPAIADVFLNSTWGDEGPDDEATAASHDGDEASADAASPEDVLARLADAEQRLAQLEGADAAGATPPASAADAAQESEKKKAWYEKLGVRGYAQVRIADVLGYGDGSFPAQTVTDASVSDDQSFLIRRARLIVSGDVHEHLGVYLQPEFAANVPNSVDANQYVQLRDWYGDVYVDSDKVHRFRVGLSKVPYGWENLQSSAVRLPLERSDALNSAVRNERDLGVFYYWTPESAQDFFKNAVDSGWKGSGNYGLFGFGLYNGQGGSFREQNDRLHAVARLTLPACLPSGQMVELGMQGYAGQYVVLTSPIAPLGAGDPTAPAANPAGLTDERLAWSFIYYPQPWGFQCEWNVGRGPRLNADQTDVGVGSLSGGYLQTMYRLQSDWGIWWPFARYVHYRGGYKSERNSPDAAIDEWDLGVEWQINPAAEFVTMVTLTDRTNTSAVNRADELSYGQFVGSALRVQFQFNY